MTHAFATTRKTFTTPAGKTASLFSLPALARRFPNIRRLPVVGRLGRVVGILTIDDARRAMPTGVSHLDADAEGERQIPEIRSVMNAQLHTVSPEQPAGRAAQLMLQFKVGALPVVEEDALVGIITESDIFRFLTRDLPPLDEDWD